MLLKATTKAEQKTESQNSVRFSQCHLIDPFFFSIFFNIIVVSLCTGSEYSWLVQSMNCHSSTHRIHYKCYLLNVLDFSFAWISLYFDHSSTVSLYIPIYISVEIENTIGNRCSSTTIWLENLVDSIELRYEYSCYNKRNTHLNTLWKAVVE